jgi:hypothetical protein
MLSTLYPNQPWLPWRFDNFPCPKHYFDDLSNQKSHMQWVGHQLGIQQLSDWYHVTNAVELCVTVTCNQLQRSWKKMVVFCYLNIMIPYHNCCLRCIPNIIGYHGNLKRLLNIFGKSPRMLKSLLIGWLKK